MSSDPGSILSCSLHKGNEKNFVGGAIVLGISHDGHTVLPSSPLKNCLENVLVVPEIKNFYYPLVNLLKITLILLNFLLLI